MAGHSNTKLLLPLVCFWGVSYQSPYRCWVVSCTSVGVPLDWGGSPVLKASAQAPERWWIPRTLEHALRPISTVSSWFIQSKTSQTGGNTTHLRCFKFLQHRQDHADQALGAVLLLESLNLLTCSNHLQHTTVMMRVTAFTTLRLHHNRNLVAPLLEQPSVWVMNQEDDLGFLQQSTKKQKHGLMRLYTSAALHPSKIFTTYQFEFWRFFRSFRTRSRTSLEDCWSKQAWYHHSVDPDDSSESLLPRCAAHRMDKPAAGRSCDPAETLCWVGSGVSQSVLMEIEHRAVSPCRLWKQPNKSKPSTALLQGFRKGTLFTFLQNLHFAPAWQ